MIESVTLFKNNNTVVVRYKSGNLKTFMKISDKVMNFILRENVKAFENEISTLYRIV